MHPVLAGGGHRSRSWSRSRSNRRRLSNARRLASNASSVVSATSVERPRSTALSIRSRCLAIYSLHSAMCRSVSTKFLRSSSGPALFPNPPHFPLYGRCIQALHFEPIGLASGPVGGILALRHDAFKTHLAGVGEDCQAIAFHVFVEPYAGAGFGHDRCERGLADLKRVAPEVIAVQLDQVEGVQEREVIMAAVANEIERGNAVVIAGDSLAVDDAGA